VQYKFSRFHYGIWGLVCKMLLLDIDYGLWWKLCRQLGWMWCDADTYYPTLYNCVTEMTVTTDLESKAVHVFFSLLCLVWFESWSYFFYFRGWLIHITYGMAFCCTFGNLMFGAVTFNYFPWISVWHVCVELFVHFTQIHFQNLYLVLMNPSRVVGFGLLQLPLTNHTLMLTLQMFLRGL